MGFIKVESVYYCDVDFTGPYGTKGWKLELTSENLFCCITSWFSVRYISLFSLFLHNVSPFIFVNYDYAYSRIQPRPCTIQFQVRLILDKIKSILESVQVKPRWGYISPTTSWIVSFSYSLLSVADPFVDYLFCNHFICDRFPLD